MISCLSKESSDKNIWFFGGIKGLVRDGNILKEELEKAQPKLILISISPEEVSGLREFLKDPFEMNLSDYEIMYGVHLSLYGEVMTPSPIYVETLQYADRNGIEIQGLDMNEEEYQELYTGKMKTFDVVRHSARKRRLLKKEFKDETAEGFVDSWTKMINKVKGLRLIDEERLKHIEDNLVRTLESTGSRDIFIVVEYEFYREILEFLNENGYRKS